MKAPDQMSNKQIVSWLVKTRASIKNAFARAGYNAYGSNEMIKTSISEPIDRYADLRREAIGRANGKVWDFYCNATGSSKGHDAYDFLA